jgi:hypothetical protein
MSERVLNDLGLDQKETRNIIEMFRERDEQLIREQHAVQHDEEMVIQSAKDTARELELLLKNDQKSDGR